MGIIVVLYCLCALVLVLYGANCHVMTYLFNRRYAMRVSEDRRLCESFYKGPVPLDDLERRGVRLPVVTTQLPIFNELNVAERLIDAVAAFRYPPGRHEVQVLDDSTDETRAIVARKVAELRAQGVDIRHITRPHRHGFKAGALRYGLEHARGDFLAIFDADFVPPPDFLLKALPYFMMDPELGLVQARWGHLNGAESMITRLQAIGINGHFMVEQSARNANDLFMNFNGTAGIFRKSAIIDGGNWQDDTLTEDMDLSYRVQLAGWRCRYLSDLVAPAEIPCDINAFKSQQFRWAKGSIQTARKLLPCILGSDFGIFAKIQAVMHLTHYAIHPLMLFLAIMALPILTIRHPMLPPLLWILFGCLLLISCTGPSRLYFTAERALKTPSGRTLLLLPIMVCFGCGLAVNNSRAVIEALMGKKSSFVRTPKKGFLSQKAYRTVRNFGCILEMAAGFWCLAGVALYFASEQYLVGHFMLIYAAGFLSIGILSWRHSTRNS